MFRHCVMFKWADNTSAEAKAAVGTTLDVLANLDMITTFRHGPDAGVSDGNWDYVVVADFSSADEYLAYANDASHLEAIADVIKPAISARAAVQFSL